MSSFSRLTRDIIDLCELQMQLLSVDSQVAKRKLARAGLLGGIAATLAGSTLTVSLVGAGFLLAETTELSTGGGLLVVSGILGAVVILLLAVSFSAIKSAGAAMSETKSEFAENLRWLKATLVSPQSSPRNQYRSEAFDQRGAASRGSMRADARLSTEPVSPFFER